MFSVNKAGRVFRCRICKWWVVDVSHTGFVCGMIRNFCNDVFCIRKVVFDFGFKSTVREEMFHDFNDFSRQVKSGQFVQEEFVLDRVEGFLHV